MKNKQIYNILYVDDEHPNLSAFKNLYRRNYCVHIADSGAKGLDILENHDIHLVITDQLMPKMTGLEFLEEAKQKSPNLPYILLTGYTDHRVLMNAINKIGIYRYIAKPFNHNDMTTVINLALKSYQLQLDKAKTQKELQQSKKKFKGIFNSMMDLFLRVSNEGIIQMISPSVFVILGYTTEELIGKKITTYYETLTDYNNLLDVVKENGFCKNFELYMIAKDGSKKALSINAKIYRDNKGNSLGIEAVLRDVTEKKQIKHQFQANSLLLKESQKTAHLGQLKLDLVSDKLKWSGELYKIFGINPKIEQNIDYTLKLTNPDDLIFFQENLTLTLKQVKDYNINHKIIQPHNRETIWVYTQAKLSFDKKTILSILLELY